MTTIETNILGTREVRTKAETFKAGKQFNDLELGVSAKVAKAMRTEAIARWIAEQGLLDRVVTVTGVGSYTVATSWDIQKVSCRMQQRGTCQGCGRDVAVVCGFIADHGFNIRWNYREGVCRGSMRRPAEVSTEEALGWIGSMRAKACSRQAALEEAGVGFHRPWEQSKEERDAIFQIGELRAYADHLETKVLPRLGQSLRLVPVADLGGVK